MSSVSAHVADTLSHHVDHVFGVMGNGNAFFLDALERDTPMTYTAMRHEAGGVAAADAFYRTSGRMAAATATYGAGFTNTLTAHAESVQARIPLILVVGDEPTSGPRPWDVGQVALASAIGARTYTVGRTDAVGTTLLAIEHALANRIPSVLAIPYDIAGMETGPLQEPPALRLPGPTEPVGEITHGMIDEAATALTGARRPLLLAGRGAWIANAGAALGRLADAVGAVTATTALARGIFPRTEYDLGVTGGFGAAPAMDLIRDADVAVVFGASLNQFTMRFGALFAPETRVFQVDTAATPTHPNVSGYIRADAALAADVLADRVIQRGSRPSGWRESASPGALRRYDLGDEYAPDGRLDPRSLAAQIGAMLPDDRVVVSDGGHFIGWANMYWPVASPDRMTMVGTAFQSIGLGLPSMAGAARAHPDSTIVLTAGDGGALMALADVESAVRVAGGRGIAVIWNDAAYGAEINLYGLKGLSRAPMLIPEVDFAAVAAGIGAEGVTVRSHDDLDRLGQWTRESPETRRFLMLDCRISAEVIAPYQHEIIRVNS